MNQEWPAIFIFPMLQFLPQLCFEFGEILCNPLAHLLLPEELSRIALLALVSAAHETRCILARGGQ
jgi:hypothetical protein